MRCDDCGKHQGKFETFIQFTYGPSNAKLILCSDCYAIRLSEKEAAQCS